MERQMKAKRYRVGIDIDYYIRMFKTGCIASAVIAALFTATLMGLVFHNSWMKMTQCYESQINALTNELNTIEERHQSEIIALNNEHNEIVSSLNDDISTLTNRVEQLVQEDTDNFDILRRYWYVFKDATDNSGLSTELLVHVDNVCKEWDVNPHWMWMIWKNETSWNTGLDNSKGSGARGMGQLMPGTGKSLYEDVLGRGTYNHLMAYDPFINTELSIVHIGRNIAISDMTNAIELYSGGAGQPYYNKVVSNGKTYGLTLNNSNANYPY